MIRAVGLMLCLETKYRGTDNLMCCRTRVWTRHSRARRARKVDPSLFFISSKQGQGA